MHYRVILHRDTNAGRGATENLSEYGAMLSVEINPPLEPGDVLGVELHLPGGAVQLRARVKWASTVLPGMVGVQFEQPLAPEYLVHYAELISEGMGQAS